MSTATDPSIMGPVCTVSPYKHSGILYTPGPVCILILQSDACHRPFNTDCVPLSYNGNPGVKRRILQGRTTFLSTGSYCIAVPLQCWLSTPG